MKLRKYPAVAALALLVASSSQALDLSGSRWSVDGFGTLGIARTDTDEAEFIRDIGQGEGLRDDWSGHPDSRLGLQVGFQVSDSIDLIAQAVSRYNYEGKYDPELNWAFVRYQPDPALQLRLGRVGIDNYMLSDSKDVGYSYLWIRPPVDYYGNRHLTFIDGGDITLKQPMGAGLGWLKAYVGKAKGKIASNPLGGDPSGERIIMDATGDLWGVQFNYQLDAWHWQVAYSELEYELEPPAGYAELVAFLQVVNPPLANTLSTFLEPTDIALWSTGMNYHEGPLQVQAAYTNYDQKGEAADSESGFLTAGYRLGDFTPFITWSAVNSGGTKYRDIGLPYEGKYGMTQNTWSVGSRYDFAPKVAFKIQLDRIDVEHAGVLWRAAPAGWHDQVTLFSVGLDFVF